MDTGAGAGADAGVDADTGVAQTRRPSSAETGSHLLARWADANDRPALASTCRRYAALSRTGRSRVLAGPTGERDVYSLVPREAVLCLADADDDRLTQLAAVLAVGSIAVWPATPATEALRTALPAALRPSIVLARDWTAPTVAFDAALHHGDEASLRRTIVQLADRGGPIVGLRALAPGDTDIPLEALVIERSLSVNTAAAGGNASLMAIG